MGRVVLFWSWVRVLGWCLFWGWWWVVGGIWCVLLDFGCVCELFLDSCWWSWWYWSRRLFLWWFRCRCLIDLFRVVLEWVLWVGLVGFLLLVCLFLFDGVLVFFCGCFVWWRVVVVSEWSLDWEILIVVELWVLCWLNERWCIERCLVLCRFCWVGRVVGRVLVCVFLLFVVCC